jgi:hypothetical protein
MDVRTLIQIQRPTANEYSTYQLLYLNFWCGKLFIKNIENLDEEKFGYN